MAETGGWADGVDAETGADGAAAGFADDGAADWAVADGANESAKSAAKAGIDITLYIVAINTI